MSSATARQRADVAALVGMLADRYPSVLTAVIAELEARGLVTVAKPVERPARKCGVCGLPYALCRRRDPLGSHEYEPPKDGA